MIGPEINNMISALLNNDIPVDPTLDIYEIITKEESQNQYLWFKVLQLTKMMYDNGVTILSGSDIPNFDLVPGTSLHHELELLVEAGIPPLEVIKIATKNGAQALGIEEDVGTIEPGKQADMIILSDNPVDSINNTKKIEAMINNGHLMPKLVGKEMPDVIQTIVTENGERITTPILWDMKTGESITTEDIKKAKRYKEKYKTDYCILVTTNGITPRDSKRIHIH